MNKNNFQVVITNQIKPDQDKNLITRKLAALFKVDEHKAAQFLLNPKTIIKDNLDEPTANKYLAAIQQTGADCKVIDKTELVDLPQIVEPPKSDTTSATPRESLHAKSRLRPDPELSLVARAELTEKETRAKLSTLQHANAETLCPNCGTIRGAVDALCLHCGYHPSEDMQASAGITKKKILVIGIALVLVATLFILFGLPVIQKILAKNKFDEDLALAFETRNQVSTFIDSTGFFPNQNIDANLPTDISNESIESIVIGDNGVMTITLRATAINEPASQTLIFIPRRVKNKLAWNCMEGSLRDELRPEFCRKTAAIKTAP